MNRGGERERNCGKSRIGKRMASIYIALFSSLACDDSSTNNIVTLAVSFTLWFSCAWSIVLPELNVKAREVIFLDWLPHSQAREFLG